ncbi:MAG TPA: hypothetical protein VGX97_02025 [bacterium]|nr:hypothetical protein [bacterium]
MKTRTASSTAPTLFTQTAVLLAGLILAIQLGAAAAPAPETPLPAGSKAYVALFDDSKIAIVDTRTNQILGYIPLLGPHDLVAGPDGHTIYVSSEGLPTVSVIDARTEGIVATIRVGFDQRGLALAPDGRELLVSLGTSDEVVTIDTARNQISGDIAIPGPGASIVSPDGRRAYVISADGGAPFLAVLDLATHAQAGRIPLDATPTALSFGPDGKRLYLTMADTNSIEALDPALNRIVARIAVRAGIWNALPTQDGRSMLVVNRGDDALELVDLASGTVSGTVAVGKKPASVAVGVDRHVAYVANEDSGDVSVVDLDRRTVVAAIAVGHGAREIVLQQERPWDVSPSVRPPAPFSSENGRRESGQRPCPFCRSRLVAGGRYARSAHLAAITYASLAAASPARVCRARPDTRSRGFPAARRSVRRP